MSRLARKLLLCSRSLPAFSSLECFCFCPSDVLQFFDVDSTMSAFSTARLWLILARRLFSINGLLARFGSPLSMFIAWLDVGANLMMPPPGDDKKEERNKTHWSFQTTFAAAFKRIKSIYRVQICSPCSNPFLQSCSAGASPSSVRRRLLTQRAKRPKTNSASPLFACTSSAGVNGTFHRPTLAPPRSR